MSDYIKSHESELYHYGTLGMKWGVRRATRLKSVYSNKAKKQIDINTKLSKIADKHLRTGKDVNGNVMSAIDRKSYKKEYDAYTKAAKKWISTRNDIMNMDVSTIKAKDIKQRFKNTNASGVYIH